MGRRNEIKAFKSHYYRAKFEGSSQEDWNHHLFEFVEMGDFFDIPSNNMFYFLRLTLEKDSMQFYNVLKIQSVSWKDTQKQY